MSSCVQHGSLSQLRVSYLTGYQLWPTDPLHRSTLDQETVVLTTLTRLAGFLWPPLIVCILTAKR